MNAIKFRFDRASEFAAPILLCLALVTGYFATHEGRFFSAVFGALLITMAAYGALLGSVALLLTTRKANALLAIALLVFLDVIFSLSSIIATWIAVNLEFAPHGARQAIGALAMLFFVFLPAQVLGRLFSQMVAVAMLVFIATTLMQPLFPASSNSKPATLVSSTKKIQQKQHLILYIILDELAAPEIISPHLPSGHPFEVNFKKFFSQRGFNLETPYKVPFNLTGYAVPALLNSMPYDTPKASLIQQWQLPFRQFLDWKDAGHEMYVVGVDFVSPCQGKNANLIASCRLFPAFSILPIITSDYSLMQKSLRVMTRIFLGSGLIQRGCIALGHGCVSNMQVGNMAGSISWYALDQISAVKQIIDVASGDTAIFAHILAPHPPLYYDSDCNRSYRRGDEMLRNSQVFYSAYADQTMCIVNSLASILDAVELRWEKASITIRGDHGLRVPLAIASDRISDDSNSYMTVRATKEGEN